MIDPKEIAKLISEDITVNNGLLYEQAISSPAILDDWNKLNDRLKKAQERYEKDTGKSKILVINGSDRNENTCPQEEPKSSRLCRHVIHAIEEEGAEATFLDLSKITAEKDLMIWPCKGCFSTSAALCHYGCTCYPNESLNQNPDWMHDEIYELLTESHGLYIITPVYWYSMPSVLKLMVDRMVCLDGANPDPTTTMNEAEDSVKDVEKARELERGAEPGGSIWDYKSNKVMAGRLFGLYVHGDAEGADLVKEAISETLKWFGYIETPGSTSSGYIGLNKPYADNQMHLDEAKDVWEINDFQARQLVEAVKYAREKGMPSPPFPDNTLMK